MDYMLDPPEDFDEECVDDEEDSLYDDYQDIADYLPDNDWGSDEYERIIDRNY